MAGGAPWDAEAAARIIERHRCQQGAALPILRALQEYFGYVDKAAVPLIAEALNLSKAEIHGVVSFYHDFRSTPVDGDVLKLCRAESCQAMGCEDIVAHLARRHRIIADKSEPGAACRDCVLSRQLRFIARRFAERRSHRAAELRPDRRDRA
jgi:formate dehydrogenase subunit gamma